MPKSTFPRDRFDELADDAGRVGAHRAENPRLRGGVVFLWATAATVVLIIAGIVAALAISGRMFSPAPEEAAPPPPAAVEPVRDTSYTVLVLNATPQEGLAMQLRDEIVGAGWATELVLAGDAGSTDFPTTTVYYSTLEDEAAAAGLAEVVGGAEIVQDDRYQPVDDPETEANEADVRQLTVVIGLDRVSVPPQGS